MQKMEPERLFSFTWHPYSVDPKNRLFEGNAHARRIQAGENCKRHTAYADRVGLRQSAERSPPRSISHERRRLDRANEEHRELCRAETVAAQRQTQAHAPVFAALGDETRLSLVAKLCGGKPRSISQLTEGSRLTRQAITKHLRVLERAGIVHSLRTGRESLFEFDPEPIEAAKYTSISSRSNGIRRWPG